MGLYFRKSQKVGPFRINYSKSGIGVSAGVKGARISKGPRGTYFNAGGNGIYYRKKLGTSKKKPSKNIKATPEARVRDIHFKQAYLEQNREAEQNYEITERHSYSNNDGNTFVDLQKIKQHRLLRCLIYFSVFIGIILSTEVWHVLIVLIIGFLLNWAVNTTLVFDLDEDTESRWIEIVDGIQKMNSCSYRQMELTTFSGNKRKETIANSPKAKVQLIAMPSRAMHVKADSEMIRIGKGRKSVILCPTGVICKKNFGVYMVLPGKLYVSKTKELKKFDPKSTPKDGWIVNRIYEHQNMDGSPDMRFKSNALLSVVCETYYVTFTDQTNFQVRLLFSNSLIADEVYNALCKYKSFLFEEMPENLYESVNIYEEELINNDYFETESSEDGADIEEEFDVIETPEIKKSFSNNIDEALDDYFEEKHEVNIDRDVAPAGNREPGNLIDMLEDYADEDDWNG